MLVIIFLILELGVIDYKDILVVSRSNVKGLGNNVNISVIIGSTRSKEARRFRLLEDLLVS